jgi:hypothetical protein
MSKIDRHKRPLPLKPQVGVPAVRDASPKKPAFDLSPAKGRSPHKPPLLPQSNLRDSHTKFYEEVDEEAEEISEESTHKRKEPPSKHEVVRLPSVQVKRQKTSEQADTQNPQKLAGRFSVS